MSTDPATSSKSHSPVSRRLPALRPGRQRGTADPAPSPDRKRSRREFQAHLWFWTAILIAIFALRGWWTTHQTVQPVPYSEFRTMVREHKVASVEVDGSQFIGKLRTPLPNGRSVISSTAVPESIAREFEAGGASFTGAEPDGFASTLFSWLLPTLALIAFWAFVFRRFAGRLVTGGGLLAIGQSRAKVYVETDVKTTFADVAGADEVKEELAEIIAFLKDPDGYGRLGARVLKGVLLVGPPGTGKTLLARAVAGEAGVPFFSISGAEFVEMFVGVGAARVRDLFQQARSKAPAIVFIDELDALGRARGAYGVGGHDEKEQTLNQLLAELDGFDPRLGVVLLAATNRPEILDPALLRAGRFDRQVLVDRPDKEQRAQIIGLHLKRVRTALDVSAQRIAALTPGLTGADLANVMNEAALLATRRQAERVEESDVTEAIERVVAGLVRKSRVLSSVERETVAYHEMDHALVALTVGGDERVHKVSIIPRGVGALGYTMQRPTDDRFLMRREELEDRMAVLLGGRAAEQLVFNRISTGAADDLQRTTDIARAMVTRYRMAERLGPVTFEHDAHSFLAGPNAPAFEQPQRAYSEATAERIDEEVHRLVQAALERALGILRNRRTVLRCAAAALLENETLSEDDLTHFAQEAEAEAGKRGTESPVHEADAEQWESRR
ncbi:ATP-dependent zinc metalloprotease FtsH [Paraburkholderia sp. SIMBA_049]